LLIIKEIKIVLEELKVDPLEKQLYQCMQKCLIMSTGWKTSDTQNNTLTISLSEDGDLDDHKRDYYTDKIMRSKWVIYGPLVRHRDSVYSYGRCLHQSSHSLRCLWQTKLICCVLEAGQVTGLVIKLESVA